jgi:exodeoxyribonuclease-5
MESRLPGLELLTDHQYEEVGQHLLEYLDKGTLRGVPVPYIVLKGYAGTGKSFVLNTVLNALKYPSYKVAMSAPTHKAVKILKRSSEIPYFFKTIHSLLRLKENISDTGKRTFVEDAWAEKIIDSCSVLVIDESSMLPAYLYESTLAYKSTRDENFRVIFSGDPLQIPPVKEYNSKVFGPENDPYTLTLEIPMRQAKDSDILNFATDLRRNIQTDTVRLNQYLGRDIEVLKENYFNDTILPMFCAGYEEDQDSVKLLAYTNSQAEKANLMVREYRLGMTDPPRIVEGDYLVADEHILGKVMGKSVILAHNSDEMKVLSCKVATATFSWAAYRTKQELLEELFGPGPTSLSLNQVNEKLNIAINTAKIKPYIDYSKQLKVYICTVELDDEEGGTVERNIRIIHEDSQADFNLILKGLETLAGYAHIRSKAWAEKFKFERSVAYVKHNYALTVHKSQGSSYGTCLVYEDDILSNRNVYERNRILYVAATRAKKKLFII